MKKVIVISTSLRRGSNSDMLADQFVEGAKSAGNEVEKISLVGKNIQFCKGCLGCQKLGHCVINPKSRLAGTLFCGGVNGAREIEGNPKLHVAYELGKRL